MNIATGCSKRLSSKAAADESTGGVALGYVEDAFEGRTQLAAFFSILLGFRLDTFNIEPDLDFVADDEPAAI